MSKIKDGKPYFRKKSYNNIQLLEYIINRNMNNWTKHMNKLNINQVYLQNNKEKKIYITFEKKICS